MKNFFSLRRTESRSGAPPAPAKPESYKFWSPNDPKPKSSRSSAQKHQPGPSAAAYPQQHPSAHVSGQSTAQKDALPASATGRAYAYATLPHSASASAAFQQAGPVPQTYSHASSRPPTKSHDMYDSVGRYARTAAAAPSNPYSHYPNADNPPPQTAMHPVQPSTTSSRPPVPAPEAWVPSKATSTASKYRDPDREARRERERRGDDPQDPTQDKSQRRRDEGQDERRRRRHEERHRTKERENYPTQDHPPEITYRSEPESRPIDPEREARRREREVRHRERARRKEKEAEALRDSDRTRDRGAERDRDRTKEADAEVAQRNAERAREREAELLQQRERDRAEQLQREKERAAAVEQLQREKERAAAEQLQRERERAAVEQLQRDRERAAAEQLQRDRERAAAEQLQRDRERAAAEQLQRDRERAAAEQLQREKERAAVEQRERDRAREREVAEQAQREKDRATEILREQERARQDAERRERQKEAEKRDREREERRREREKEKERLKEKEREREQRRQQREREREEKRREREKEKERERERLAAKLMESQPQPDQSSRVERAPAVHETVFPTGYGRTNTARKDEGDSSDSARRQVPVQVDYPTTNGTRASTARGTAPQYSNAAIHPKDHGRHKRMSSLPVEPTQGYSDSDPERAKRREQRHRDRAVTESRGHGRTYEKYTGTSTPRPAEDDSPPLMIPPFLGKMKQYSPNDEADNWDSPPRTTNHAELQNNVSPGHGQAGYVSQFVSVRAGQGPSDPQTSNSFSKAAPVNPPPVNDRVNSSGQGYYQSASKAYEEKKRSGEQMAEQQTTASAYQQPSYPDASRVPPAHTYDHRSAPSAPVTAPALLPSHGTRGNTLFAGNSPAAGGSPSKYSTSSVTPVQQPQQLAKYSPSTSIHTQAAPPTIASDNSPAHHTGGAGYISGRDITKADRPPVSMRVSSRDAAGYPANPGVVSSQVEANEKPSTMTAPPPATHRSAYSRKADKALPVSRSGSNQQADTQPVANAGIPTRTDFPGPSVQVTDLVSDWNAQRPSPISRSTTQATAATSRLDDTSMTHGQSDTHPTQSSGYYSAPAFNTPAYQSNASSYPTQSQSQPQAQNQSLSRTNNDITSYTHTQEPSYTSGGRGAPNYPTQPSQPESRPPPLETLAALLSDNSAPAASRPAPDVTSSRAVHQSSTQGGYREDSRSQQKVSNRYSRAELKQSVVQEQSNPYSDPSPRKATQPYDPKGSPSKTNHGQPAAYTSGDDASNARPIDNRGLGQEKSGGHNSNARYAPTHPVSHSTALYSRQGVEYGGANAPLSTPSAYAMQSSHPATADGRTAEGPRPDNILPSSDQRNHTAVSGASKSSVPPAAPAMTHQQSASSTRDQDYTKYTSSTLPAQHSANPTPSSDPFPTSTPLSHPVDSRPNDSAYSNQPITHHTYTDPPQPSAYSHSTPNDGSNATKALIPDLQPKSAPMKYSPPVDSNRLASSGLYHDSSQHPLSSQHQQHVSLTSQPNTSQATQPHPSQAPLDSTSSPSQNKPSQPSPRREVPIRDLSHASSRESLLRTPSSLAPSLLIKPTTSRMSTESQNDRKKGGLFRMFKPKTPRPTVAPHEIWYPQDSTQRPERDSPKHDSSPKLTNPSESKSSLASRVKVPPPVKVPIQVTPSGRQSPQHKVFTPFRFLTSRRHRTMSSASVDAQDGTAAANTTLGSPTVSMTSQNPLIPMPPTRDPQVATAEWRDKEEAEIRDRQERKGKVRRMRPGVVFDVLEDPMVEKSYRPAYYRSSSSKPSSSSRQHERNRASKDEQT